MQRDERPAIFRAVQRYHGGVRRPRHELPGPAEAGNRGPPRRVQQVRCPHIQPPTHLHQLPPHPPTPISTPKPRLRITRRVLPHGLAGDEVTSNWHLCQPHALMYHMLLVCRRYDEFFYMFTYGKDIAGDDCGGAGVSHQQKPRCGECFDHDMRGATPDAMPRCRCHGQPVRAWQF